MNKIRKSIDELEVELVEQIAALRASIVAYDAGTLWEAKRLAASIYILCFDGSGRTKSLLGMVGKKSTMKFVSSYTDPYGTANDLVVVPSTPLLYMHTDNEGGSFKPNLGRDDPEYIATYPKLGFSKWWDEILFYPSSNILLSRKNMIFCVRSKDGGGHVDDHITSSEYYILKTVGDPRIVFGPFDKPLNHPGNIVWPIVRQIAWEVDYSLRLIQL